MRRLLVAEATIALLIGMLGLPTGALAATPSNDDFANATIIRDFPFSETVDVTGSTVEANEPGGCNYQHFLSVWYVFTPAVGGAVTFNPAGSFYDSMLNLYESNGPGFGGLTLIGCSQNYYNTLTEAVQAGHTYYLEVTDFYGWGGGTLSLAASFIFPPANDDFANASLVGDLPFSDTTSNAATTGESGETPCAWSWEFDHGSVWYQYTASSSGWLTASATANHPNYFYPRAVLGVYTGDGIGSLVLVGCADGHPGRLSFSTVAGQTYRFQLTANQSPSDVTFELGPPPAPVADFYSYPSQANIFGAVQFQDQSTDPAGIGFDPPTWSFGDGTTATGTSVSHMYATDGDYTVEMTATTTDGRTARASRVVAVRTHDLGIAKFTVPTAAKAGQTRSVTVSISNHRYPETGVVSVWVGAFPNDHLVCQPEGLAIPVLPGSRTTNVTCNYTFTAQDALVGSVTFRASVGMWIMGVADANPANNSVTAIATRVNR